jgi:4-hydroxy-tetrahydrodipicolinate synthase
VKISNTTAGRSSTLSPSPLPLRPGPSHLQNSQFLFDTNERFSLRPNLATQITQSKALRSFYSIQMNGFLRTPISQHKQKKHFTFFYSVQMNGRTNLGIHPLNLASTRSEGDKMFTGCGTALVTPFRQNLSLDESALRRLIRRQIDAGIDFLVPCGTTGENPTLTRAEHLRVVEITVEESRGQVPVLAGAGGYNTSEVVELAKDVESLRADGILSVTPYYNKPTQEGLYQHYKAIAAAISIPIIVYSVQGRTGVNVEPATLGRLAKIENIAGIKEASGNIGQIATIVSQAPENFSVLSGDDAIALPVIALGGHGVISVVANEIPAEMTALVHASLDGNFARARELQKQYLPLMEINFIESNPGPAKAAMAEMGLLEPIWRLPLVAPKAENLQKIRGVLESTGLLGKVHAAATN